MATILFGWEQGLGLGHVVPHLNMLKCLKHAGHHVVFAARKPERVSELVEDTGIEVVESPLIKIPPSSNDVAYTYADILHNIGWGWPDALLEAVKAWHALFYDIKPDLFVMNYCPTGLLASQGYPMKRALLDHGFTIPPPVSPMPNMRSWVKVATATLLQREQRLLATMNHVAKIHGFGDFRFVGELFSRVDACFFLGYPELECYPRASGTQYWGSVLPSIGESPSWPRVGGKRVFVYLRQFETLPALIKTLKASDCSVLMYAPSIDAETLSGFVCESITVVDKPLNINEVSAQCDLAITHSGYNMSVDLLMAGCPLLLLPLFLESFLIAQKIEQMGAGLAAPMLKPQGMADKLQRLLNEASFGEAAQRFADKYAEFDRKNQPANLAKALQLLI